MSVLEHVAGNLRRLRQQAGLSQQALAEAAQVSRRMLVAIESGDANVSLNTLDRLAAALGVQFADLLKSAAIDDPTRVDALAWCGRDPASRGVMLSSVPAGHQVELWQWTLMPGERYASQADPAGWRELLLVIEGTLTLESVHGLRQFAAGEHLVFASDAGDYAYRNDGDAPLRLVRNVVY
ncbi:XRE family transcriptional regulator [Pseudoxanthomonas winnipegensis]|jgi:transcriptional regulator with XRE-family HTH domain|uniref:XRE family transcriptional regulator n=1 Tax=Pseudoxanthomonas winnipegensis TaxID=2480810 RepID=A0ABY1WBU0_9GAMM|nr:XRE family transcriptional regulator [Pseudoxanthomonas winnipegensis]TAA11047.1 XRE family transcriptional regulator [Pseudoxanthomonas winnipegensis]TAA18473.1 XRE family transcriptional regulator [Pseudoxanthomonas winnipegensis]TAH74151.1 XRE family transcriptional regulator [Pseudoxanthomonas winnipegensis]